MRDGAHGVVGDAGWVGAAYPGGVGEERVEAAVAAIVEVYVYTTKVVENEVSNCVCALDGLRVVVEGGEEPWIFGCYELA